MENKKDKQSTKHNSGMNLRMDNSILNGVNMKNLYRYVKEHPEMQTERIYNIVVKFRRDSELLEVQKQ